MKKKQTLAKRGRTQKLGNKTKAMKHSPLMITNKEPGYEYSFRRKADIEAGGGQDIYGYVPVCKANSNNEAWDGPKAMQHRTTATHQIAYLDTVLCKRPEEVSEYFQELDNDKYNSQTRMVMEAGNRIRHQLRSIDPGSSVRDSSEVSYTQRPGPTEQEA